VTTIRSALLLGALFCNPVFAVDRFAIEAGQGNHWMKGGDAAFVRYLSDITIPNFPKQPAFYEISLGHWSNKHDNTALGLSLGIQERWGDFHLVGSAGVGMLEHKTHLSNTHQQFILRVGVGYTVGKFDFSVFQTHYSNCKTVFEWDGKNVGYDFITFQVSHPLK